MAMQQPLLAEVVPVSAMTPLTSYADVEEAFKSRAFAQAGGGRRHSAPVYGETLLSLSGDAHFRRRRVEATLFRHEALIAYERDILRPALLQELARCAPGDTAAPVARADVIPLVRRTLLRISVRIVGLDEASTPEALDRLDACVGRLSDAANVEWSTRDHEDIIRVALPAKEAFVEAFFSPAWRRRVALVEAAELGDAPAATLPVDLLTRLLQHRREFERWDEQIATNEAILFVVANAGSPSSASGHVLAELLAWLAAHPEDREQVQDPGFLRACAEEALRLHPPSPYVIRRAVADTILGSGRRIHEGEHVTLQLTAANRDPAVFGPDADRFRPHRTGTRARHGLAFGAGPHTCIGKFLTIGESGAAADDPTGTLIYILREFFLAGICPDPDRSPRKRTDNTRDEYASYPILLPNLAALF